MQIKCISQTLSKNFKTTNKIPNINRLSITKSQKAL